MQLFCGWIDIGFSLTVYWFSIDTYLKRVRTTVSFKTIGLQVFLWVWIWSQIKIQFTSLQREKLLSICLLYYTYLSRDIYCYFCRLSCVSPIYFKIPSKKFQVCLKIQVKLKNWIIMPIFLPYELCCIINQRWF